jgi:peptidoglycan/LPS O-acetylase OafA/YrhL
VVASLVFLRYYRIGLTVFTIIDFILLWLAITLARPPFDLPAVRFVGAVSYSWYLYHAAIGYAVIAALLGTGIAVNAWAVTAATLGTLVLAWASYRFVERPGIEFGKQLESRIDTRKVNG